jgi:hypothetical protein
MKIAATDSSGMTLAHTEVVPSNLWRELAKTGSRVFIGRDLLIVLILAALAACASYKVSQRIDPVIFDNGTLDLWFDADIPRNFVDMTSYRSSEYYVTRRHPLLLLMEFAPVYVLRRAFGLDPITSVRITLAAVVSFGSSARSAASILIVGASTGDSPVGQRSSASRRR